MRLRTTVLLIAISSIGPLVAGSQERPSLERLEAAICAKADVDGDTYRPAVCDPRCDCLLPDLATLESCEQQPTGKVRIVGRSAPQDVVCIGECAFTSPPAIACIDDTPCQFGCIFQDPSFNPTGGCTISGTCTEDADCDPANGFTCQLLGPVGFQGLFCASTTPCGAEGVCATGITHETFDVEFDFLPAGDLAPASCGGAQRNSNDIAQCIAEIDAELPSGTCVICGDGNEDAGEECDDGNTTPGDGCAADCTDE